MPRSRDFWYTVDDMRYILADEFPCEHGDECSHLAIGPQYGCYRGVQYTMGLLRALESKAFAEQKGFLEEACREVEAALLNLIEETKGRYSYD